MAQPNVAEQLMSFGRMLLSNECASTNARRANVFDGILCQLKALILLKFRGYHTSNWNKQNLLFSRNSLNFDS